MEHNLPDWHPHEDYSKGYAARADLGGGVTLTQIHEIDFMTWIFGDVLSSKSYVGKFSNLNITSDDLCSAIFLLKNNIIVELHMDFFVRPYYKRIKIRANGGIILWDSTSNKLRKYDNINKRWDLIKIKNNYKLTNKNNNHMYVTQIDYYLDCLLKNKQPMNNLEEANIILNPQ